MQAAAALISELGKHAFDIEGRSAEELHAACASWIGHLLAGGPSPADPGGPVSHRDWPGLRDFVARERRAERGFVEDSIRFFHTAFWEVARQLALGVSEAAERDRELRRRLAHLRERLSSTSDRATPVAESRLVELTRQLEALESLVSDPRELESRRLAQLAPLFEGAIERAGGPAPLRCDDVTGFLDSSQFAVVVERTHDAHVVSGGRFFLALARVDRLEAIVASNGHHVGNAAVCRVAESIARQFSQRGDLLVARRIGEVAVIARRKECSVVRKLLRNAMADAGSQDIGDGAAALRVSFCAGVASPRSCPRGEDWVRRAERALDEAARQGRDQLAYIDP